MVQRNRALETCDTGGTNLRPGLGRLNGYGVNAQIVLHIAVYGERAGFRSVRMLAVACAHHVPKVGSPVACEAWHPWQVLSPAVYIPKDIGE